MAFIIHLEALMFCKRRLIAILLGPPQQFNAKKCSSSALRFGSLLGNAIFRTAKLSSHPLHLHHLRVETQESFRVFNYIMTSRGPREDITSIGSFGCFAETKKRRIENVAVFRCVWDARLEGCNRDAIFPLVDSLCSS